MIGLSDCSGPRFWTRSGTGPNSGPGPFSSVNLLAYKYAMQRPNKSLQSKKMFKSKWRPERSCSARVDCKVWHSVARPQSTGNSRQ